MENDSAENSPRFEDRDPSWWWLGGLLLLVALLWVASWVALLTHPSLTDWGARAAFGDMFGAVNALFSGLAFAGVIYAILLQHRELGLQREELRSTREEIRRTAEAQEQQSLVSKGLLELEEERRRLDYYERARELDVDLMIIQPTENDKYGLRTIFDNCGAPVFDVQIVPGPGVDLKSAQRSEVWYPGPGKVGFVATTRDDGLSGPVTFFQFVIIYTNKLGQRRTRAYSAYTPLNNPGRSWLREVDTVDGEHPNLLEQIRAFESLGND